MIAYDMIFFCRYLLFTNNITTFYSTRSQLKENYLLGQIYIQLVHHKIKFIWLFQKCANKYSNFYRSHSNRNVFQKLYHEHETNNPTNNIIDHNNNKKPININKYLNECKLKKKYSTFSMEIIKYHLNFSDRQIKITNRLDFVVSFIHNINNVLQNAQICLNNK